MFEHLLVAGYLLTKDKMMKDVSAAEVPEVGTVRRLRTVALVNGWPLMGAQIVAFVIHGMMPFADLLGFLFIGGTFGYVAICTYLITRHVSPDEEIRALERDLAKAELRRRIKDVENG